MPVDLLTASRQVILDRLYWVAGILGVLALLLWIPTGLSAGASIQEIGYFAILIGLLVVLAIFRRVAYNIRLGFFLGMMYLTGVQFVIAEGLSLLPGMVLMAFTILASLMSGLRTGLVALSLSTLSLGLIGGLISSGDIPLPGGSGVFDAALWFDHTFIFFAINSVVAVPLTIILRNLTSSLTTQNALTQELRRGRAEIDERTRQLEHREQYIRTASQIARRLNALLEPQAIMQAVVSLMQSGFDLYYIGLFLIDETGEMAVLKAGSGEAGQRMLDENHALAVGGASMVGWAAAHSQPRIALDVGAEAVRFNNPHLPLTRSELALPLLTGEKVLGVLSVQSTQPAAFDQDDILILEIIADGLATALENAELFNQTQARLEEIQSLHQQYLLKAWTHTTQNTSLNYTYTQESQSAKAKRPGTVVPEQGEWSQFTLPLSIRGQTIGHLELEVNPHKWSQDDQNFVTAIVDQAALALENARLLETTQRTAMQERINADLSAKVWASPTIEDILQTTLDELGRSLEASAGQIALKIEPPGALSFSGDPPETETA